MTQEKRRDYAGIARRYAQNIASGKIVACKWTGSVEMGVAFERARLDLGEEGEGARGL